MIRDLLRLLGLGGSGPDPYDRDPDAAVAPSTDAVVIRTDFSDQAAWELVRKTISTPLSGLRAYVQFADDREYDGITGDRLRAVLTNRSPRQYAIVADRMTMAHPDHPLRIIDLTTSEARAFRALPTHIASIENNLSIANMDFVEFADAVHDDGIFRGFPS
ncbi:MAG: hypothetical protein ABIP93_01185 [Gemmatimonadaceae bacterium]